MSLPAWIRAVGLAEHFIAGGVLAALLAALGTPAAARVVAVAAVGIAHELGDGDFTKAEGAPWNGILDVLAFLPVPLVWLVLSPHSVDLPARQVHPDTLTDQPFLRPPAP